MSSFGVIPYPSTRRRACDHCHSQKLRCTRSDDSDECVRCRRLSRLCVWSAPLRGGRPTKTGKSRKRPSAGSSMKAGDGTMRNLGEFHSQWEVVEDRAEVNYHAQARGHVDAVPQPFPLQDPVALFETPQTNSLTEWNWSDIFSLPSSVPENLDLDIDLNSNVPPSSSKTDSLHDITKDLSDFNLSFLSLDQSLNSAPWKEMFQSPSTVIAKLTACNHGYPDEGLLTSSYPMTEIFNETQRFTQTLKQIRAYFTRKPLETPQLQSPPISENVCSSTTETHVQPSTPDITGPRKPYKVLQTDLPTALLISAIYTRLLEVYTTILTHLSHFVYALSELSRSDGPDYPALMRPVVPQMQWGTFQAGNYDTLQMMMVVQVASSLPAEVEREIGVEEWDCLRLKSESRLKGEEVDTPDIQPGSTGDNERLVSGEGLLSLDMIDFILREEEGKAGALRDKFKTLKAQLQKSIH